MTVALRSRPLVVGLLAALVLLLVGLFALPLVVVVFWLVLPLALLLLVTLIWSGGALVALGRQRRARALSGVLAATLPGLFLVGSLVSGQISLHAEARSWLLRPALELAVDAAREQLGPRPELHRSASVPAWVCLLGARCTVESIGTSNGHPVMFINVWHDLDPPMGYAHFVGPPDREHAYGQWTQSWLCPTRNLGGGWWWMEYTWPNDCMGNPV